MLNIISRSYVEGEINGPNKVVRNLIKGLEILGYPYCVNKDLAATSQLWIHDDPFALEEACRLKINAVAGPNIYILPKNIPSDMDMSHIVYIQPSKWICDFWKDAGFRKCTLDVWPAAIDASEFMDRQKPESGGVLIYYKQRHAEELDLVKKILEKKKIDYEVITYGSYSQKKYVEKLRNTRYVFWLGRHETQGIALEEALAMNVPILVWDVKSVGHWVPRPKDRNLYTQAESAYANTTSAEYFDERCGIKIKNEEEIERAIDKMETGWKTFSPRQYILENLGLEKQANELISLYTKYFGITYANGEKETLRNDLIWKNAGIRFRIFSACKSVAKKILGKRG